MANNSFQYLTSENVVEVFKTSRQYTEGLTDGFHEYERIARNKPHGSIPKEYPKTTDGTTASIIRKTGHRIIQQIPTGTVKSDDDDWLSIVASFIYTHKIIPYANEGYALIQKSWNVIERFLTFGFCPMYTPFVEHGGYFCPDLRLPYWGDIFLQPGKLSDEDSNYIFMRSWWQTKDIDALIANQSKLSKNTEKTWNVDVLRQIKDFATTKDEKAKTPAEREKNINTKGGVELITGFQRGIGAEFLTFHVNSGLIARTKTNKDPRGEMPLSFAYGDIDGSNPFGRSIIDLVGGLQNLMDGEMQMYQYNRALQLNPPLIKRGTFNKNKVKFAPNTIIDVGADPNATVEPLKIDTTALANFPNNYGLMKSQLINLLASPDTSISASVGNPGFSKTPQGVEAGQATLSVDDNYVRKQWERAFERWSETAINVYFAERTGIEEIQLDDETADALRGLDDFDQSMLSDDNKIRINYDTATPALHFRVNASSSQMKNDLAQQQIAKDLLDTVMKYPMLNSNFGGSIDVDALARKIVVASAISDPETIAPEPTKAQKQAKLQSKQQPSGFSPLFDKPQIRIDYKDVESATSRAGLLQLAGAPPAEGEQLPLVAPGIAEQAARQSGTPDDPAGQPDAQAQDTPLTPDHVLKAHDQAHQQEMDKAKLLLETAKAQQQGEQAQQSHQLATKQANKPQPTAKPAKPKPKKGN